MASKKALDDKHEKIIRGLLKEPDNRMCMGCTNNVRNPYCNFAIVVGLDNGYKGGGRLFS
jgi:hypothetical protein